MVPSFRRSAYSIWSRSRDSSLSTDDHGLSRKSRTPAGIGAGPVRRFTWSRAGAGRSISNPPAATMRRAAACMSKNPPFLPWWFCCPWLIEAGRIAAAATASELQLVFFSTLLKHCWHAAVPHDAFSSPRPRHPARAWAGASPRRYSGRGLRLLRIGAPRVAKVQVDLRRLPQHQQELRGSLSMQGYNFTERVRQVLAMAREEAAGLRHEYVGTEHMLLGVIREGQGTASAVITNF